MADQQPFVTGQSQWRDLPTPLTQIYQQGWGQLGQQLARPYTTYNNPRIADLSDLQRQAMSTASGLTGGLGSIYQNAMSAIGQSAPTVSAPGGGGGVDMSKIAKFNPTLDKSKMMMSSGAWTDPGVSSSYMSPYTSGVVDRIAQLGGRNLRENLLPGINSTFTGAGQFGSTRNADFTNRALRDTQESILGEQAKALESGYNTAGNLYGTDAARALQAQQGTASNLLGAENLGLGANTAANQAYLQAGQINSQAAQNAAQMNLQAQIANQNAAQNRANQWLSLGNNMVGGLSQAANLQNTLGQQQQGLNQQNLNLAYQDFMNQQQYPMTNLQNVMSMANPTANITGSGTEAKSYVTPGTSTAQRMTGVIGGLGQLAKNGAFDGLANTIGSWF